MPLDDVAVFKYHVVLEGDWLCYHGRRETVPLGHEVAIRDLPNLDVDDDAQVLAFTAAHGFLDTFHGVSNRLDRLVVGPEPPSPIVTEFNNAMAASGQVVVLRPEAPHGVGIYVYLPEAREVLRVARSLARHLVAHLLEKDVAPAWEGTLRRIPGETVSEEEHAWISFASYLTEGLKGFAARVEFTAVFSPGDEMLIGAPRADLFSGLCHQLFNLFVDDAPVMPCANETCTVRAFAHQAGGAIKGQYRTKGVIYCSKTCARAQVERQRRRRLKGETQ